MDHLRQIEKIDFLLDGLARGEERGKLARGSYDSLAPDLLKERAALVAEYVRGVSAPASSAPGAAGLAPSAPQAAGPAGVEGPLPLAPAQAAAKKQSTAAAHAAALSWSQWVAIAGSFLLIVAAAIFSAYAWVLLDALGKLGLLATVTAAMFVGGESIRLRLKLPVVGTALLWAGSAMVIFDGFLVILAFDLRGPWPWAAVFLISTLVSAVIEGRLRTRWFGGLAAASQLAWWWLAADAFHVPMMGRLAIVAVVGALWTLAGRLDVEGPLAGLLWALGVFGPAVAAAAGVGAAGLALGDWLNGTPVGLVDIVWAAVATAGAALAYEITDLIPRGVMAEVSVFAWLPVVAAVLCAEPGSALRGVAVFGSLGLAALALGLWRGGHTRPALGVGLLLAAELIYFGRVLSLPDDGTSAVMLATALALLAVGLVSVRWARFRALGMVAETWGWLVLWGAVAFVAILSALRVVGWEPSFADVGWRLAVITASCALALLAASALRTWLARDSGLTPGAVVGRASGGAGLVASSYAAALAVDRLVPAATVPLSASAGVAVAVAWDQLRAWVRRLTGVGDMTIAVLFAIATVGTAIVVPIALTDATRSWSGALLFVVIAAGWAVAAWRDPRDGAFAAGVVPAAATAAFFAVWAYHAIEPAGAAAAAVAAASSVVGLAPFMTGDVRAKSLVAGAFAAVVAAGVIASGSPGWLAAAAVCAAVPFAVGAFVIAAELAGPSAAALIVALVAGLQWGHASAAIGLLAGVIVAVAFAVPRALSRGREPGRCTRMADAVAMAGAVALGLFTFVTWLVATGWWGSGAPAWLGSGLHGAALLALIDAGFVAAWSWARGEGWGVYAGTAMLVLALELELGAFHVKQAEAYLIPAALWSAGAGYWYARPSRGRVYPVVADVMAVALGLAVPVLLTLLPGTTGETIGHAMWAIGLSVVAIVLGVVLKARGYFWGGLLAVVVTALALSLQSSFSIPVVVGVVAATGVLLIAFGAAGERRRRSLDFIAGRGQFASWR